MNSELVITPADPACSELRELIAELDEYLTALYPPESKHGLSIAALQKQSVTMFLAKLNGMPAGCGGVKQLSGYAEVKRLYVRPRFRGRGIGQQLMSQIEAFVAQANGDLLRLETGIDQPEAIRLYEKLGFYPIPPFGDYKPDPLCLFLEKRLALPVRSQGSLQGSLLCVESSDS